MTAPKPKCPAVPRNDNQDQEPPAQKQRPAPLMRVPGPCNDNAQSTMPRWARRLAAILADSLRR